MCFRQNFSVITRPLTHLCLPDSYTTHSLSLTRLLTEKIRINARGVNLLFELGPGALIGDGVLIFFFLIRSETAYSNVNI